MTYTVIYIYTRERERERENRAFTVKTHISCLCIFTVSAWRFNIYLYPAHKSFLPEQLRIQHLLKVKLNKNTTACVGLHMHLCVMHT